MDRSIRQANLSSEQVSLLLAIEQAEGEGRWCAVAVQLSELRTYAGAIALRSGDWINAHVSDVTRRLDAHLARYGVQWPELTKAHLRTLNAIDMNEERGNWSGVRSWVEHPIFRVMEMSRTDSLLEHLRCVRERLACADIHEEQHGTGSLLLHSHPAYVYRRKHKAHLEKIRANLRQPALA